MTTLEFTPRDELSEYEWTPENKRWARPKVDHEILKELYKRSTLNGFLRVGFFVALLAASAVATVWVSRHSLWLAIPVLYVYYFFYGFWVAIAHELQHRTVFAKSLNWFSEILFFIIQVFMWNSPRYARISHQLHHRYTMVRGVDPETDWPEVITTKWLRRFLLDQILAMLVVKAVPNLCKVAWQQVTRALGHKDRMMRDHCTERDNLVIRIESLAIFLIHLAVLVAGIWFRRWEPIAFMTLAWQIGSPIEGLWHNTEHIGRLYGVNDQRLATRSIRVNPLVKMIYWGLDDHVDHHDFPTVPSRNLPKLHKLLRDKLPEPKGMIECWREMFAIAREKDQRPTNEHVPI